MGREIDKENYKLQIKDLMSKFDSLIFPKHIYLNSLNSDNFPSIFKSSLWNMLVFVLILVISLFIFIVDINISFILSLFLVSLFISNTIDLVLLTIESIKKELTITDIYNI